MGDRIDSPGAVNPRVLKEVVTEGRFLEDPVAQQYFGGILAASRTDDGMDDRGAIIAKKVASLSVYQIRLHYLLYYHFYKLHRGKQFDLTRDEQVINLGIFLPFCYELHSSIIGRKDVIGGRPPNEIFVHATWGLNSSDLVGPRSAAGDPAHLKSRFPGYDGSKSGMINIPWAPGAELFMWALGFTSRAANELFLLDDIPEIEPSFFVIPGAEVVQDIR